MINRPADLLGLLALFWKPAWESRGAEDLTVQEYIVAKDKVSNTTLTPTAINGFLWLLNPQMYRQLANPGEGGFLRAADAYQFIPPILSLIQLKRTAATEISGIPEKGSYRIKAEIPPVRWVTVELQMKRHELP